MIEFVFSQIKLNKPEFQLKICVFVVLNAYKEVDGDAMEVILTFYLYNFSIKNIK